MRHIITIKRKRYVGHVWACSCGSHSEDSGTALDTSRKGAAKLGEAHVERAAARPGPRAWELPRLKEDGEWSVKCPAGCGKKAAEWFDTDDDNPLADEYATTIYCDHCGYSSDDEDEEDEA